MIRKAQEKDINKIVELIKLGAQDGQVLVRSNFEVKKALDGFCVAQFGRKIVGCCSLEIYSSKLAELRSLVVLKDYQNKGIGRKLVRECLKEARKRGVYEVLSITDKLSFFNKLGFYNTLSGQQPLFKRLKKR